MHLFIFHLLENILYILTKAKQSVFIIQLTPNLNLSE